MKENTKVLYIQGFRLYGKSRMQLKLEKALGENNIIVPYVNIIPELLSFFIFLLFVIFIIGLSIYSVSMGFNKLVIITCIISTIVILYMYYVSINLILYYLTKKAIKLADEKILTHRPDVIVGSYFGGIIAMNLKYKRGKKPLVLISPSKKYQKFTQNVEIDLSDFPYVIIVSGIKDKVNTLNSCQDLISTVSFGKGRLDILDDNHSYSKIKESDFKAWVNEAKHKGLQKANSFQKSKNGKDGIKINVCELTLNSDYLFANDFDSTNANSENELLV